MIPNQHQQVIRSLTSKHEIFGTSMIEKRAALNKLDEINQIIQSNLAIDGSKKSNDDKIDELEKELRKLEEYKRKFDNLVKDGKSIEEKKRLGVRVDEKRLILTKLNEHAEILTFKIENQNDELDFLRKKFDHYKKSATENLELMLTNEQDNAKNITSNFAIGIKNKDSEIAELKTKLNEKSKECTITANKTDEKMIVLKKLKAKNLMLKNQEIELKIKIAASDCKAIEKCRLEKAELEAENIKLKRDLEERILGFNKIKVQKSKMEKQKNRQISNYEGKLERSKAADSDKKSGKYDSKLIKFCRIIGIWNIINAITTLKFGYCLIKHGLLRDLLGIL